VDIKKNADIHIMNTHTDMSTDTRRIFIQQVEYMVPFISYILFDD